MRFFLPYPRITRCSRPGSIHTEGSCLPFCVFFIPVLTRVGCDFCRAIADCCCPSTAWCAWLPSACRCPWPSACSPRCLRYSKVSAQPSSVLQIQGQLAERGAAGEKFKLLIHHLKCTSAASRACVHLFAPDVSSNV